MKLLLNSFSFSFFLVLSGLTVFAQDQNTKDIIIGQRQSLYSKVLQEDRELYIALPPNYERNVHSYPIIIVLDGEYLFELTQSLVKIKASRNEMPESIIVGIPNTEGGRYDMAMELSYPDGRAFFGDADGAKIKDYLAFFQEELLPFLREHYRVNSHGTIIGMSPTFGPVLEAFWNEPDLFDAHIVLASELAVATSTGETVANRVLQAIQDPLRGKSALYIGKAADDLNRRPEEERLAYDNLNQLLTETANPAIKYKIEILDQENHYGMAIQGIEHGLETVYPYEDWRVPFRDFWRSESPATAIKAWYDEQSIKYGFEILPLEDAFYASQTLSGTIRRLARQERKKELLEVLQLAVQYYPNSPAFRKKYEEAVRKH